ncbi:hypothetical protein BDZ45DRAFT_21614 [Acephala macrosclerotiorum]|nr:hypothetical protein BDZ45DRAFT_21614 [Acephala macrosclerotiorum]
MPRATDESKQLTMATFQTLPTELRLMIYSLPRVLLTQKDGSPPPLLSALAINPRLVAEALSIYQSVNLRILSSDTNSLQHFANLSPTKLSKLQHITIMWSDRPLWGRMTAFREKLHLCTGLQRIVLEVGRDDHFDGVRNGILGGFVEMAGRKIYDEGLEGVEICINGGSNVRGLGSRINVLRGLAVRKQAHPTVQAIAPASKAQEVEMEAKLTALTI